MMATLLKLALKYTKTRLCLINIFEFEKRKILFLDECAF